MKRRTLLQLIGCSSSALAGPATASPATAAIVELNVATFGATGDGIHDDAGAIHAAFRQVTAAGGELYFPAGTYRLGSRILYPFAGELRLRSDQNATLVLDECVFLQGALLATAGLSEDARRGDVQIRLDSRSSPLRVDDILRLYTATPADVSYGYRKQCVRRVREIDGDLVHVDQPLEWFFTRAEGTRVGVIRPGRLLMTGIGMRAGLKKFLRLDGLAGSRISKGDFVGPAPHNSTPSDPIILNFCDDTVFDGCSFTDGRYFPNINSGSRRTTVRNFRALRIRHIDANCWAEDTLIENGEGRETESLIQSHPSIRTTIRNVRDFNTDAALGGLNMRGLGDVVEDCEATSSHGKVITDTSGIRMQADYIGMSQEFTRRYSRFRSNTAGIGCRYEGRLIVEDCQVPAIFLAGSSYHVGEVQIDERTRGFSEANVVIMMQGPSARHVSAPGPIRIPPVPELARKAGAKPVEVADVRRGVRTAVVAPGHGMAAGDAVRLAGMKGCEPLNGRTFVIRAVSGDELEIGEFDHGDAVDSKKCDAYRSGGLLTPQARHVALAVRGHPAIGWYPKAHYVCTVFEGAIGDRGLVLPLKFRHESAAPAFGRRNGRLVVRARTAGGSNEAEFSYRTFMPHSSRATVTRAERTSGAASEVALSLDAVEPHFLTQMREEGSGLGVGNEAYFTCRLTVSAGGPQHGPMSVEVEVEEWREPA